MTSKYCEVQFPPRPVTINDTLQTVRIGTDNRVTFSIYAPKATEVTVGGDFTLGGPAAKLTKEKMAFGLVLLIPFL